ncbi:Ingression protein fic1 [Mycena venus]|uniref:Ingression protein fic1 n=1 Tax=Mycena venus TaxID=2733690 RepID=A0A8H7CYM0_9AGAR|nr:Ingression protein fic1 [Mycena venus]
MSSTPREIGTLIVVILKANHLPNKRNIGKQDPYCLVAFNGEKQRTKVVKKGGQHPEWDEELRFKLYEDDAAMANGPDGAPPPPPPKDGKKNIKGGIIMKLSCFADDPREPSLIGQADVDLTEVLTKGETDEWFTLMNKDKFAGKVYLELTFWSNEPPPEKKVVPVVPKGNHEYGGQGSFVSSDDPRTAPGFGYPSSRVVSTSDVYAHSRRQSDSGQSTLRSSNSLAQLDLYRPPYEQPEQHQRGRVASFSTLTNDFGELGLGDAGRRRESLPPVQSSILHGRPPSSIGIHRATYPPPHGYEPSMSDAASMYPYERPLTPPGQSHEPSNFVNPAAYTPQAPYQPQYDSGPLSNSNSSSFVALSSHPSEPSGFSAPLSHTPAPPSGYAPSHINPPTSYAPVASQTPAPGYPSHLPPSSSASFHSQPGFPPSQSQYSHFQPQPPPQQYNPPADPYANPDAPGTTRVCIAPVTFKPGPGGFSVAQ